MYKRYINSCFFSINILIFPPDIFDCENKKKNRSVCINVGVTVEKYSPRRTHINTDIIYNIFCETCAYRKIIIEHFIPIIKL